MYVYMHVRTYVLYRTKNQISFVMYGVRVQHLQTLAVFLIHALQSTWP